MEIFSTILKIMLILIVSIPGVYSYFGKKKYFVNKFWLILGVLGLVVYLINIVMGVSIFQLVLDSLIAVGYLFIVLENIREDGK